MSTYKDLDVWKKSFELSFVIYQITKNFPKEEVYGLTSQLRRAAVSLPSNIAEGSKRGSKKDFQLASSLLYDVMRMLTAFIKKLSTSND